MLVTSQSDQMNNQASDALRATLEELLSESPQSAAERESNAFDAIAGPRRNNIILFGSGGLGRKCLAGLRQHGIEPIAFADNNPKLWGTQVNGLAVMQPSEAATQYGATATFVITIWGALSKDRMRDRETQVRSLGCQTVVPFGPLFWKYPDGVLPHYAADLPHRVLESADDILECYDLWADSQSRHEYLAQIKWRLTFDFGAMGVPDRESIYFPTDLINVSSHEVFVDCGAFDGDTLDLFLRKSERLFDRAFAFEPDPVNFSRLQDSISRLPDDLQSRIELKRVAVGSEPGRVHFSAEGTASSAVGSGDLEVECVALDQYLGSASPSMIKMDIEGAEPDALHGCANLIREKSPRLAISCYHRQDHLWSIPLLIRRLAPQYRFYLRPHDLEGWDLVCYAIPHSEAS